MPRRVKPDIRLGADVQARVRQVARQDVDHDLLDPVPHWLKRGTRRTREYASYQDAGPAYAVANVILTTPIGRATARSNRASTRSRT